MKEKNSSDENNNNEQEQVPTGLICLTMLLQYLKKPADPETIKHEYCPGGEDLTPITMVRTAKKLGVKARYGKIKQNRLEKAAFPLIAHSKDKTFFIIAAVKDGKALIQVPGEKPEQLPLESLWARWDGQAVFMTSRAMLAGKDRKFDISWFIPVVVKYRKLFKEVLLVSFFIQLFALVTPFFFQVVMDKVLVNRGLTTLDVLVVGLLVITIFDITLNGLRTYVFSHTTSRVDVELGSRLFDHMMRLPIAYFSSQPVGQIVARVRELESIRSFLTGNALTVVLDLFFTFVFFIVMYFYAPTLTYIVLGSIPVYFIISFLITPELRARTEEKFQRGAVNQAFLTESITGMETLKSMAVEPQMRQRWEEQLAGYVKASFRSVVLGIFGGQSVQLVSRIVSAILLWKGAQLVINGDLTVGQLIAFNMLSGQVAAPILRLAQLWQDFQQFRISLDRLGDVLNVPQEPQQSLNRPTLPPIRGKIQFDDVHFRYSPTAQKVLQGVNLEIGAGQIIGVVGRSGSGKSTLTKLIQRLYIPEQGRVMIDGNDLALLDPAWLRRQVGVVLQENILFNRSIKDNIALTDPTLSMERIIAVAQMAGAHEFILKLPQGYDTLLGERGAGLSGGQRQRIAIARALVTNPRVLIFDEATSALDYESERAIQDNMQSICRGRTVIIIAHRLSTVRHCDRILTVEEGVIIEDGSHDELLESKGRYAMLWSAQIGEA
ncbi:type I secretion system permease/ATPase [Parashewanella spongiae]|uniref:Type I secretion system permease/ATPase n=1 Tax=Parashewanella spongiae TaxID=342950 RepID=A0A3A6TV74_9GAMM|nr:type I secretion system permease/ATPase [Parashewanella spongiae]MCL1077777.1 type I secretion system permease/ATPase [Parashewanella spongiae]RJY18174.1 type I secretion system permease/ATPase [Parashewanella spongiae]